MPLILHKFHAHTINPETEILILGTFNPDIPQGPTFFYGRPKNHLWQLLPGCWGVPSLKQQSLITKQIFMSNYKIDFADLIHEVDVPLNQQSNYLDTYIDGRVSAWKDIVGVINQLPELKAVYFTRKTFGKIPNIQNQIINIQNHCHQNKIRFCLLETPARFSNLLKQQQWISTIITQTTCLRA